MTFATGTGPMLDERESVELLRLSPITNTLSAGTVQSVVSSGAVVRPPKT
jgi:hypothetical protein